MQKPKVLVKLKTDEQEPKNVPSSSTSSQCQSQSEARSANHCAALPILIHIQVIIQLVQAIMRLDQT
jgi:hypothetical protein